MSSLVRIPASRRGEAFFDAFPDYRNVFESTTCDGDVVTIVGRSECSEPALAGPVCRMIAVRDDKVASWRVDEVRTDES